jgi:beta-glucosidase
MKKFCFILIIAALAACNQQKYQFPFQNPDLTFEERVDDLLSRMTLEQKVSQLVHDAPAIDTLGIPSYNWWNECLHGVARAGIATVFPQAIGLAATWDTEQHFRVATAISDEARAKHHEFIRNNQRKIYQGLTFWSPNINIFRDPRWGRGQETYGEDPYLTAQMGTAFVKGLQGDDPKYLKLVATPKHYAVHSGPEPLRHVFNADVSDRDLWDTYLPAFRATVTEGHAYSVMCAYNRFREKACCGSDFLIDEVLRKRWGFEGYVVSDCGAITDIHAHHKIAADPAEASAIGVISGCDLECGSDYSSLVEAVKRGLVSEKEIDTVLRRLLLARFKLGMFDPPERVPYASIPISVNDCQEHRQLSLESARKSIVLLKNEKDLLPLSRELKNILVTGPNADNAEVLLGNYNGFPSKYVTVLQGIKNKAGQQSNVVYEPGCGYVDLVLSQPVPAEFLRTGPGESSSPGLIATYFKNSSLSGSPFKTDTTSQVDFNFDNSAAIAGLPADSFSIRWTGCILPPASGTYFISVNGDDGYRLLLDGKKVIENWTVHAPESRSTSVKLEKGKAVNLVLEYFESLGGASIQLHWQKPGDDPIKRAVLAAANADVVIMAGGISPSLEGEEMGVNVPGFSGGDRTDIELPQIQRKLLQALKKTGKPIVLVLLNGSALGISWEKDNIPAIVEGWYPGQEGGTALADVIFGDYNPAGRLPVTFYKSVKDLPPFDDYHMKGRTYRYFEGEPLYPFGYGLSYADFEYSAITLDKTAITASDTLLASVSVKNTSQVEGEEVIQLYISDPKDSVVRPIKELKGFQRLSFKPGESKEISFVIRPDMLAYYDYDKDENRVEPGKYTILIGSSSVSLEAAELTVNP